jgi:uncharacterized protein HemX
MLPATCPQPAVANIATMSPQRTSKSSRYRSAPAAPRNTGRAPAWAIVLLVVVAIVALALVAWAVIAR